MLVVVAGVVVVLVIADDALGALTAAGVGITGGTFGDRLALVLVVVGVAAAATATTAGACSFGVAISEAEG